MKDQVQGTRYKVKRTRLPVRKVHFDIALYMGFIRGEYSTEKQRNEYKMKKLASRVCKPKTVTVQLRPNNKWSYGL
ncbi:MAG: hypothetical protein DRQ62_04020 [Gammaproteobacteria bacterium]|nr:MAG: hypothetical protein DRQ62_04020 [Gammaproteobacteria bacterium]